MEYRVLARKYRPTTFADLVGQEVLVRTLSNAIQSGKIAHAFLLTGIRGIGKTTTARIIARALNCIGADGNGGATIQPCGVCSNCTMIAQDRHPDVLEMDAASHTGVNDVRDLIETVRYLPTSARTKVYIIDEVHMLSNSAFNALLKTLEEPPPHVKFIFATTEVRKIPVTILSRCQRFDLKRLDTEMLATHLGNVASKENISIEPEALTLLSIAAEGSVRDGLSLLDRAIAHADKSNITSTSIRDMLGLADRSQILELLHILTEGKCAEALALFRSLYEKGADPQLLLQDCLELVHFITRIKILPAAAEDPAYSAHEREKASSLSQLLSMPVLTRLWQMILKGLNELKSAPSPIAAAEMILARISYSALLPTPEDAIKSMADGQATFSAPSNAQTSAPTASDPLPAATHTIDSYEALVALFEQKHEALLASQLRQFAVLVSFKPGEVELYMKTVITRDFTIRIANLLKDWTGEQWKIMLAEQGSGQTLEEQAQAIKETEKQNALSHPLVASVMQHFPGATVQDVKEAV